MKLSVIILAAGQGTRMKSRCPKVLHPLAGISLLERVIKTAQALGATEIHVVYGAEGEKLKAQCKALQVHWVPQEQALGTAHAVQQALPYCDDAHKVLVLYGDVPLISIETLQKLLSAADQASVGLLTAEFTDPTGLGRIIRDAEHRVSAIVEHRDATEAQRAIHEINTGILCAEAKVLKHYLAHITNHNAQQEYYLTDLIKLVVAEGKKIADIGVKTMEEAQGVNDRWQLANLERHHQREQAKQLCLQGVTLMDPNRFDLRGELEVSSDVTIDVNVVMEGRVKIGTGSKIGPNVVLKDTSIGEGVEILANSVIEGATIADHCVVGPFARIRPGTQLAQGSKVGNFVELKNTEVGTGSKINHLSYVGDTQMGSGVNVGAGVITCNYDGAHKHRTVIEDDVFVGSNASLVAPVILEKGATIGAGSVITQVAPAQKLSLSRVPQTSVEKWERPKK